MKKFDDLYRVAKDARRVIDLEGAVYNVANFLTKDTPTIYDGGLWVSEALPNGGFVFVLDDDESKFAISNSMNGATVQNVSARVLSIASFLLALSHYSFRLSEKFPEEKELLNAICDLHSQVYGCETLFESQDEYRQFYTIID